VRGVLPDADIAGYLQIIFRLFQEESRREIWHWLNCATPSFEELGLPPNASDRDIWQKCQEESLVLITANRNKKESDSLEATIRTLNEATFLPVITLANPDRIRRERDYANVVADDLLEYLFDIDKYLGTGRLFLPRKAKA
jgi:hypothetical protein